MRCNRCKRPMHDTHPPQGSGACECGGLIEMDEDDHATAQKWLDEHDWPVQTRRKCELCDAYLGVQNPGTRCSHHGRNEP